MIGQKIFDFITDIVEYISSLSLITVLMIVITILIGLAFGGLLSYFVVSYFGG